MDIQSDYSRSAGRAEIITRFHLTNFFRTLKMFPVVPKSKVCIIRSLRTNNTPPYLTPRLGSQDLCIALLMGGQRCPPPISNRPQSIALTASFPDRGPVLDMTVCLYQVAVVRYSVAGRPLGSALGISGGMLLRGGQRCPPISNALQNPRERILRGGAEVLVPTDVRDLFRT